MYLNCHTYYSFRYGTLSIKGLLAEAERCGVNSIALTDINNTSAIIDFVHFAKRAKIKPVAGIDFRNGSRQEFVGIAKNNEGFYELNKLLTHCLSSGEAIVPNEAPVLENAFIIYPLNNIPKRALKENEYVGVRAKEIHKVLFSPLKKNKEKLVLLAPVNFRSGRCEETNSDLNKRDFNTHRLLRAVANNSLLTRIPEGDLCQYDEIMLREEELLAACSLLPEIAMNAARLLEQCSIDMSRGVNRTKKLFGKSAEEDYELLHNECYRGLEYRYGNASPEIITRMEKELKDVRDLGFVGYFLMSWDIVRYARERGFYYVGRGSGANSILAYCLKITDVDPIELDLYFERFINAYRTSPPDFDLDFSWKDRDEIIQYIFDKYGTEHTALLATYSTFQYNAMIRELGKVFGLPKGEIDELAENGLSRNNDNDITRAILKYSKYIHDFPNHLSIHAGGILISEKPMNYYTALSMPPKGFPVTQFSMLEAEDIGLHKLDILSQRGLGHIKDSVEIIKRNRNIEIDIHDIKKFKKDKKIAALIKQGKCMGCFYVESPAMRMLLKKLRCDDYLTLVAASSIIRPGVSQSGMMREYIMRFHDPQRMYQTPRQLLDLLKETYGVMVYQEDVIKVAHYFAGLSLGEADVLRRGMSGKFRSREEFQKIKQLFFDNCNAKGYAPSLTAEVWRQIESFAGYSFAKGHSASFAVESYQSLFLKAHYPMEFMVGVINNFGGYYRTEYYIHEARMCGAKINAPCVNMSDELTTIYGEDLYLGLGLIAQLERKTMEAIICEREKNGPYKSLHDFGHRVMIGAEQLRALIRVGAFRFTGISKKQLLWDMIVLPSMAPAIKNIAVANIFEPEPPEYVLPELHHGTYDDILDEIELLGFSLSPPFSYIKDPEKYTMTAADLQANLGKIIEIAGYYVTYKPTRTIKYENMMFGTFLDRNGYFFDTTHFPKITEQYPFRGKAVYLINGKVVEDFGFFSIDVISMEKIPYAFV